jgi:hypothetical protein
MPLSVKASSLHALAAAISAAVLACACARIDPGIRRIDSMVRQLRAGRDGMLAVALSVGDSFSYPAGTEVIARSDSSGVRKIELTAIGDMGRTEEDFFFSDGELKYCERRIWRNPRGEDPGGSESTGYYFKDGKISGAIDLLSGKRRQPSGQLSSEGPSLAERAYYFQRLAVSGLGEP